MNRASRCSWPCSGLWLDHGSISRSPLRAAARRKEAVLGVVPPAAGVARTRRAGCWPGGRRRRGVACHSPFAPGCSARVVPAGFRRDLSDTWIVVSKRRDTGVQHAGQLSQRHLGMGAAPAVQVLSWSVTSRAAGASRWRPSSCGRRRSRPEAAHPARSRATGCAAPCPKAGLPRRRSVGCPPAGAA